VRFVVIGAGGYSKEVADLVAACGHQVVGFVDESYTGVHQSTGLPVVGSLEELAFEAAVIAIGDRRSRARWYEQLRSLVPTPTLVHPTAVVSPTAVLGEGVQIMQFAVVNAQASIGDDSIINVAACVAHDCVVGPHSHVAPAVQMGGCSSIGEGCLVGTSATILPAIRMGAGCVIGAGAVVISDVAAGTTAVGVPARPVPARPAGGE
jgi:sugar O-acyltransferase (sialic acid O-acetyltransferase NeuD family)